MRADHSVPAGSHLLLPSPDQRAWHPCDMASKNLEMFRKFAEVLDGMPSSAFIVDNPSTASRVHGLTPTLKCETTECFRSPPSCYICSTAKNRTPH